ncbi:cytochrome d ubiquinol oxidase subunit II [Tardiphaga sp. 862_B3_N4_1]|uniref:cytochrome d ubiquinol oxidase subunit II n=1 Tax=Tardiphaga sp. 862_B3_N4_1 TaxID=3240764 RepID=UPI003F2626F7
MLMYWVALLAISILIYLLLDGFDLGVGILFLLPNSEPRRRAMLGAIAPFWDGNETWLVVTGVILWGAFPIVYSTVLSAFYFPVVFMLLGLILRGVAFEFRNKTVQFRWVWNVSFAGGSLVATFMQGVMVGALAKGLPVMDGAYTGGMFGWLSRFSVLCGAGLCLGYSLLGACWLVRKCSGAVRQKAHRQIPLLAIGVLLFLILVFSHALLQNMPILNRWMERPYLFVFPAIGAAAACVLAVSILRHNDHWPFHMVSLIFVSAFGTLALSFWPYMIPFSITIDQAAAPHSTLAFMFWGEGLFIFPLMLIYTVTGFRIFKGKLRPTSGHY